jgi:amidase
MDVDDYAACDATELRSLIGAGEVTASEVREAALRAIEVVEPRLNAVVGGPYDDSSAVEDGPLAGVPFAVKDTLLEAGRPLGFGTRMLEGFVASRDATLAERFRAAGLISLVRSATPEFAFNIDTAPVVHGPTRNPWSPERGPGGSSGGSAALVASRAVPMAHANDGGGSIRIPAAWCGLVGLKPSRGRVPLGPAVGEAVGGFAHEFALTRSVRDAALLLDAVNGPAPGDRYYVARPGTSFSAAWRQEPGRLRVAVHTRSFFGVETAPEARSAVQAAADALARFGHHVEEACPAVADDALRECVTSVWSVDLAELAATFEHATGRAARPGLVEAASWACIRHGRDLTAIDLQAAARVVNSTARRWGRFLDDTTSSSALPRRRPHPPRGRPTRTMRESSRLRPGPTRSSLRCRSRRSPTSPASRRSACRSPRPVTPCHSA